MSFFSIIVFPRYEHDQLDDLLSLYVDPIGIAVIRVCYTLGLICICFARTRPAPHLICKMKHQLSENGLMR